MSENGTLYVRWLPALTRVLPNHPPTEGALYLSTHPLWAQAQEPQLPLLRGGLLKPHGASFLAGLGC